MLRELRKVRQIKGEPRRRWFSSPRFDLIVWYNRLNSPCGFQLCYNVGINEKAITWHTPNYFSHMKVDDGEGRPFRYKETPIMVKDGKFNALAVLALFRRDARELPSDIARLIITKLIDFGRHKKQLV